MSDGRAWEGNVKARPTASLVALAEEPGPDDIAGVQVYSGLLAEAERRRQVTRLVRGQLVRELWACLPNGWPAVLDDANRFKVAKALGLWSSLTPTTHEERVDKAGDALLATPPPPGWLPRGPDDALLLTLLPDVEV